MTDSPREPAADHPAYLRPYREALDRFGPTFDATLWSSRPMQIVRFRIIAQMIPLDGRTVVDAGCGLGDFAAYLVQENIEPRACIGLEALPEMVEAANARNIPRASFLVRDFAALPGAFLDLPGASTPDVIVFSGSLNTFLPDDARVVLDRAWNAARIAVVFNFLSARGGMSDPPDPSPARRFDPLAMLDWALARTPCVQFRQDYFEGHDATIALSKRSP